MSRPLDERNDRPFRNLADVHRAGYLVLARTFPIGSVWEVGPFLKGKLPEVVRVTGVPYTRGVNYSGGSAKGQPTWYIPCETIWAPWPFEGRHPGHPPHVLGAITPHMAQVAGLVPECCCCCQRYAGIQAENELLRAQLAEAERKLRVVADTVRPC